VRVLEIGIGGYQASEMGGASLRMWKHYFRRGLIHGLDIADKSGHDETRVRTIQGDQSDVDFLVALNERHGPFDIVVDDGSHLSEHVIVSMTTLFPLLRHGGLYVVEDLETSYWPAWNGGRTDPGDPGTSVGFLKSVVDELLTQDSTGFEVAGMHFYHNMVVMEKGANREQSAPAWVRG
jgi:demethylmacrocin O-methyltransferase